MLGDVLSDRSVLESTYFDKFSSFRPIKKKINGESIFLKGRDGECLNTNKPCALSVKSVSALSSTDSHYESRLEYKIFTSPDTDVKENDFLVIEAGGRTYEFLAGASAYYSSHIEINISKVVRA